MGEPEPSLAQLAHAATFVIARRTKELMMTETATASARLDAIEFALGQILKTLKETQREAILINVGAMANILSGSAAQKEASAFLRLHSKLQSA